MNLFSEILLVIIGIAIYLNIGWLIGAYYHENVFGVSSNGLTILGKVLAGGWVMTARVTGVIRDDKLVDEILMSFLWPICIGVVLASWLIFGICWFVFGIYRLTIFFLKITFAGGIAKLICPELTDTNLTDT